MKPHRRLILPLLIGLVLVVFAISIAQTSQQPANQKKQTDSCCAMDSCCCHGGSCDMKDGEKTDSTKHCCGDSCDMKMKHDAKNHASEAGCCCCSDSCNMETHDAKNASAKPNCCASQTAGNTTAKHDMKNMKNHDTKNHDLENGCCCCSDSCEMKPTKSGF